MFCLCCFSATSINVCWSRSQLRWFTLWIKRAVMLTKLLRLWFTTLPKQLEDNKNEGHTLDFPDFYNMLFSHLCGHNYLIILMRANGMWRPDQLLRPERQGSCNYHIWSAKFSRNSCRLQVKPSWKSTVWAAGTLCISLIFIFRLSEMKTFKSCLKQFSVVMLIFCKRM